MKWLTSRTASPTSSSIMRSYAIDTLFDSEYYTGDTEEIETTDALKAPDSAQFITAIQKEVHSLITETRTLIPITRGADGYLENTTNKRIWKIRTTLKCKRKKKPNGEPDKHKARAAARGDTLRRSMIKAHAPLRVSYSPTIMPLTFALFLQLAVIQLATSVTPTPARAQTRPRTALIPIPRLRHYTGQKATAANQPSTNHTTYALSRKHSAQSWTAKTPHQPYFPPTTKTTH